MPTAVHALWLSVDAMWGPRGRSIAAPRQGHIHAQTTVRPRIEDVVMGVRLPETVLLRTSRTAHQLVAVAQGAILRVARSGAAGEAWAV